MALYLAYGSNLNRRQMAHRCPTATYLGSAILSDYELLFRGRYGGAVATIEKKKGSTVPVGIWEISDKDEKALDVYEGFPTLYRKETVKVDIEGKNTDVMVYIMNDKYPYETPSRYYYETIEEGYRDCDLDTKFLKKALKESIKRM